jgi:2,5-furandicarboxylate decarboxylase 1
MNKVAAKSPSADARIDVEAHRLRRFVGLLEQNGELEVVSESVELADIASRLEGNSKAVLFRKPAGNVELVGSVLGSRRRLALALGVSQEALLQEVLRRLSSPIAPIEVPSSIAPVHQVVWTGADADFTKLPIHLQHADDGGPYISASIDISRSIDGRRRNVGYRRMMLRGPHEAGIDMIAPSDFRALYAEFHQRKERMPVAFIVGSHPADSIAATVTNPIDDEVALMGGLRGAAIPLVQCATIDAMVPADAEIVLEGYLDEDGWSEPEGPYGEYIGYYGRIKTNPVFHLTAIAMRRDALFQTITISGRTLAYTDTAQLAALRTETAVWDALRTAIREPVAVYATPSCGGMHNVRVSLRPRYLGEARNALHAVMASNGDVKNVFAVDEDIDIFSDAQMDWALATRFQPDRDLVVSSGFRVMPLDPSLQGSATGGKAGFDLTLPLGWRNLKEFNVPLPPSIGPSRSMTVLEALKQGPQSFRDLMEATGSRDGREVVRALDAIRKEHGLIRSPDGRHHLKSE